MRISNSTDEIPQENVQQSRHSSLIYNLTDKQLYTHWTCTFGRVTFEFVFLSRGLLARFDGYLIRNTYSRTGRRKNDAYYSATRRRLNDTLNARRHERTNDDHDGLSLRLKIYLFSNKLNHTTI